MRRVTLAAAVALPLACVSLVAMRGSPTPVAALPRYNPVVVYADLAAPPVVVRASLQPRQRGVVDHPMPGEPVRVQLTAYCLRGTTRRGRYVRPGIVAADPRIFPLARYVELFIGTRYYGRFLVDDTGAKIRGAILDVWKASCGEARRFGRRYGTAVLVPDDL